MSAGRNIDLAKRVRMVIGHLTAIEQMIENQADPEEIHRQFRSVDEAFRKSILGTFDSERRFELAERIVDELENCPGSCGYCDLVETLKRDFPTLTLTEVLGALHRLKKKGSRK